MKTKLGTGIKISGALILIGAVLLLIGYMQDINDTAIITGFVVEILGMAGLFGAALGGQ